MTSAISAARTIGWSGSSCRDGLPCGTCTRHEPPGRAWATRPAHPFAARGPRTPGALAPALGFGSGFREVSPEAWLERRIEGYLDRPGRVLKAAPPSKRHTPPCAPIKFHEPWRAIGVTEELQHEQASPANSSKELLARPDQVFIDALGLACGRCRPLRVHHPHPSVSAPPNDTIGRHVTEYPFTTPSN